MTTNRIWLRYIWKYGEPSYNKKTLSKGGSVKNYALKIDFPATFNKKKKKNKVRKKKTELAKNNPSSMALLLLAQSVQRPFVHDVASAVNKFFCHVLCQQRTSVDKSRLAPTMTKIKENFSTHDKLVAGIFHTLSRVATMTTESGETAKWQNCPKCFAFDFLPYNKIV